MRVMAIGDTRGRNAWKKFGDIPQLLLSNGTFEPEYDKYIFMGDYVDSISISHKDVLKNLNEIISFKDMYPDHVELILGEHDIQYLLVKPFTRINPFQVPGYTFLHHTDYYEVFYENEDSFLYAYQEGNFLFTHGLATHDWYHTRFNHVYLDLIDIHDDEEILSMNLAESFNLAFEYRIEEMFDQGHTRCGNRAYGAPIWEDFSKAENVIRNHHHITSHTFINNIRTHIISEHTSVTNINCSALHEKFYSVEIPTLAEKILNCKC